MGQRLNLWSYQSCYKHCKPNPIKDTIITVMCAYCHRDEMPLVCHARTLTGEPCQRDLSGSAYRNYCNHHINDDWSTRFVKELTPARIVAQQKASEWLQISIPLLRDIINSKMEEKVYFIRDGRYGRYVKIGTSKKPYERLESLSRKADTTLRPEGADCESLYIAYLVPGGRQIESWFHGKFYDQRVIGEWFYWDDKMTETITHYEQNYKELFND